MPTFRKVPTEVAQQWASAPAISARVADDRYSWVGRPAKIYLSGKPRPLNIPPRIGDVVRLRAATGTPLEQIVGVVLDVRLRQDGIWTHVQIAIHNEMQWVSKSTIAAHMGRLKGITRVDQPTKMLNNRVHGGTHGWFVRIYEGKAPQIARTFSDLTAGGKIASLKAALAFHAEHVGLNPELAIAFP